MNTRCRDIESQAIELKKKGCNIFLLTQSPNGAIHVNFESYGFVTCGVNKHYKSFLLRAFFQVYMLAKVCYKNKIDVVFAHLEPSNFIAVLAQSLIRSKVIICRHHIDEAKLYGFEKSLAYRITYRLAKKIIVVSREAKSYMVNSEKIGEDKVFYIPLSYNFSLYAKPVPRAVKEIKKNLKAEIVLLTICRLTKYKRPELSIMLLYHLVQRGVDAKLVILGKGEMQEELERIVGKLGMQAKVYMPGYVSNVSNYMAAADFFIHPSVLDSSSISMKEAALCHLPVVVCKDVGDFNSVIQHERNGFVVDKENFVEEAKDVVLAYYENKELLERITSSLELDVKKLFSIENNIHLYDQLLKNERCF
jgi:glycosyltransferase involved in cell wall biosynthesis